MFWGLKFFKFVFIHVKGDVLLLVRNLHTLVIKRYHWLEETA